MDGTCDIAEKHSALTPLLARLPKSYSFAQQDDAALRVLADNIRKVRHGHVFKRYGQTDPDAIILLDGIAVRTRITNRGERRIVGFLLPGETSVAKEGPRTTANYELAASGDCIAVTLPLTELERLESRYPSVRTLIEWNAQQEIRALQNQIVASMGESVEDKLMFLLHDLHARLARVNKARGNEMDLSLRQYDLADAIGASTVQVSKVLKKLRKKGLVKTGRSRSRLKVSFPGRTAEPQSQDS